MPLSQSWLEHPAAVRGIFVEIQVYNVLTLTTDTLYWSTHNYVTNTGDVNFNPIINNSFSYSETMSYNAADISMSVGDIEILNLNGEYDDWLNPAKYIWTNRSVTVYCGDPLYGCADLATLKSEFILVYSGIVADIDSKSEGTLNIKFRDKMERLNSPLTEDKLGSYGVWANMQSNQDDIKPLVFGEVHNMSPMLIDPSQLEYYVNNGVTEGVIEIRDNGVPIYTRGVLTTGATIDLATGKIKLTQPLAGEITASVQGVQKTVNLTNGAIVNSSYNNTAAQLIALIVLQYGNANTRLLAADIDWTNFNTFNSAHPQYIGLLIVDKTNTIEACTQIAQSVGASLYFNRLGLLQLLKFGTPTSDPSVTITAADMLTKLTISERIPIVAAYKIGYCKNWTVQESLLTGIPDQHKDMFKKEWYTKTGTNNTVKNLYKIHVDPEQKDTLLLTFSEAQTEADRLTTLFSQQRTIYTFKGTSRLLSLKLGQQIKMIYHRYDLYNGGVGRDMQVVGLTPDWISGTIEVRVVNL